MCVYGFIELVWFAAKRETTKIRMDVVLRTDDGNGGDGGKRFYEDLCSFVVLIPLYPGHNIIVP